MARVKGGRPVFTNEDICANISLRQLRYLVEVAEHGSISAAASALNMSQPSLSENLNKIEAQVGVQLAIRGHRGIQMTQAGVQLAAAARGVLESFDTAISQVRQFSGEASGPVAVGLPPGLSILVTVPLVESLFAEHPGLRVSITEVTTGDILTWLESDRLDIGCVYEPYDSATFIFEPLLIEQLFLIAAPDNWPGIVGPDGIAVEPIPARQLADYPLVTTGHQAFGTRGLQGRIAKSLGIDLNVIATMDSLSQLVKMVSRASAFAVLPHGAVHEEVARGDLLMVPIADPPLRRTAYLARKRARSATRAVDIAADSIRTIVRELVEKHGIEGTLPERRQGA